MTLCFQALTVQVQERNHFRGNLSGGNFLTDTIHEIIAVRFDHQAAVLFCGKSGEECPKGRLSPGMEVNLRLLEKEELVACNGRGFHEHWQRLTDAVPDVDQVYGFAR